eukprot:scaffold8109_cov110-Isochrysis_galbana.AAC.7
MELERTRSTAPPKARRSRRATRRTETPAVPSSTAGSCHHSSARRVASGLDWTDPGSTAAASSSWALTTQAAAPRSEESPAGTGRGAGAHAAGDSPLISSNSSRLTGRLGTGGAAEPKLSMLAASVCRSRLTSEAAHAALMARAPADIIGARGPIVSPAARPVKYTATPWTTMQRGAMRDAARRPTLPRSRPSGAAAADARCESIICMGQGSGARGRGAGRG